MLRRLIKTAMEKVLFQKDMLSSEMCLDKLRKIRKNYKKHFAGHYFQCRSRNIFSEGRGKAVITPYNGLQCFPRSYKK